MIFFGLCDALQQRIKKKKPHQNLAKTLCLPKIIYIFFLETNFFLNTELSRGLNLRTRSSCVQ